MGITSRLLRNPWIVGISCSVIGALIVAAWFNFINNNTFSGVITSPEGGSVISQESSFEAKWHTDGDIPDERFNRTPILRTF